MNYKKMRLILIVMLIFTNLIMVFSLLAIDNNDRKIYDKMIEDNVLYLQQKGIIIDEKMLKIDEIDENMLSYSAISLENIEVLLDDISSSENNLFIGENGTAKINDDGSFAINISATHTKESIENLLNLAGVDFENIAITQENDIIKYTLKFEEILVSNCFFEVILNSNTTTIAGNFVFGEPQIIPSENSFNSFVAILDLQEAYDISGEISGVGFTYVLSDTTSYQVLPVYKVVVNGKIYTYDIFNNSAL